MPTKVESALLDAGIPLNSDAARQLSRLPANIVLQELQKITDQRIINAGGRFFDEKGKPISADEYAKRKNMSSAYGRIAAFASAHPNELREAFLNNTSIKNAIARPMNGLGADPVNVGAGVLIIAAIGAYLLVRK